jgi:hypothetical protein
MSVLDQALMNPIVYKMATKLFLFKAVYKSKARNTKFETISNDQIPNVQNKKV